MAPQSYLLGLLIKISPTLLILPILTQDFLIHSPILLLLVYNIT